MDQPRHAIRVAAARGLPRGVTLGSLAALLLTAACSDLIDGVAAPTMAEGVPPMSGVFRARGGYASLVLIVTVDAARPERSPGPGTKLDVRLSCGAQRWSYAHAGRASGDVPVLDGSFVLDASYTGLVIRGRFESATSAEVMVVPTRASDRVCAVASDAPAGDLHLTAVWGAASADVAVIMHLAGDSKAEPGARGSGEEVLSEFEYSTYGPLDTAGCSSVLVLDDEAFASLSSWGHGLEPIAAASGVSLDEDFGARLAVDRTERQILGPTYREADSGRLVRSRGSEISVAYELTVPGHPEADFSTLAEARSVFPAQASWPPGSEQVTIAPDETALRVAEGEVVAALERAGVCGSPSP